MALGFDKIKQLDDYQIEFEMMNLDINLPLYEGVIHKYSRQEIGS